MTEALIMVMVVAVVVPEACSLKPEACFRFFVAFPGADIA